MKRLNLILGLIATISIFSCSNKNKTENNNSVKTGKIHVETIIFKRINTIKSLQYSGVILPLVNIPLSFERPGSQVKIYVGEGDQVKKG